MQMYKVAFTSRRGRAIETGLYLVCASNADQAKDMVSTMFNIPPKATDFDVSRIKPSIYRIKHTDFIKDDITAVVVNSSAANHPSQDEGALYEISVSSKVFAFSEKSAIRKLSEAMTDRDAYGNARLSKNIKELDLSVHKQNERVRPSRMEQQSIYSEKKIFAGGAARPR